MFNAIKLIGKKTIDIFNSVGSFAIFFYNILYTLITCKLNWKQLAIHMKSVGVDSLIIVIITGLIGGLLLALQGYMGAMKYGGGQELIGVMVSLGVARELGPILTGIMISGRAASAMAAQISTMQISEEIDALKTLNINPYQYLIVPRIFASSLILPFVTIISIASGILGSSLYCKYVLSINHDAYLNNIKAQFTLFDMAGGLIKSALYGLILSSVACYQGSFAHGGTQGIAKATTKAVVISSILILVFNHFLSLMLFHD